MTDEKNGFKGRVIQDGRRGMDEKGRMKKDGSRRTDEEEQMKKDG